MIQQFSVCSRLHVIVSTEKQVEPASGYVLRMLFLLQFNFNFLLELLTQGANQHRQLHSMPSRGRVGRLSLQGLLRLAWVRTQGGYLPGGSLGCRPSSGPGNISTANSVRRFAYYFAEMYNNIPVDSKYILGKPQRSQACANIDRYQNLLSLRLPGYRCRRSQGPCKCRIQ